MAAKLASVLSLRVAISLNSFNLQKKFSILLFGQPKQISHWRSLPAISESDHTASEQPLFIGLDPSYACPFP